MTIPLSDAALYAAAIFALFMTPGPVWVALLARALSGGFSAAWPLALGVVVGDVLWPLLAILGMGWVVQQFDWAMGAMQFVAAAVFFAMGYMLIRKADVSLGQDSRLTRKGAWAGFIAGVAVILGNPKAILFYMGVLPGFFDLSKVTPTDIAVIISISIIVPFVGNLLLAAMVMQIRAFLSSPKAIRRTNMTAGILLILVGCVIAFL